MKKLYLLLLLTVVGLARLHAQSNDPTRATLNNIFAPLDKAQVPTGFLAEYGLPLATVRPLIVAALRPMAFALSTALSIAPASMVATHCLRYRPSMPA